MYMYMKIKSSCAFVCILIIFKTKMQSCWYLERIIQLTKKQNWELAKVLYQLCFTICIHASMPVNMLVFVCLRVDFSCNAKTRSFPNMFCSEKQKVYGCSFDASMNFFLVSLFDRTPIWTGKLALGIIQPYLCKTYQTSKWVSLVQQIQPIALQKSQWLLEEECGGPIVNIQRKKVCRKYTCRLRIFCVH